MLKYFLDLPWWGGFLIAFAILLKLIVFYPHARRSYLQEPQTGSLIGEKGVVIETLDPLGKVKSRGSIWRAKAIQGSLKQGQKVKIVATEGIILLVEKKDDFDCSFI